MYFHISTRDIKAKIVLKKGFQRIEVNDPYFLISTSLLKNMLCGVNMSISIKQQIGFSRPVFHVLFRRHHKNKRHARESKTKYHREYCNTCAAIQIFYTDLIMSAIFYWYVYHPAIEVW